MTDQLFCRDVINITQALYGGKFMARAAADFGVREDVFGKWLEDWKDGKEVPEFVVERLRVLVTDKKNRLEVILAKYFGE